MWCAYIHTGKTFNAYLVLIVKKLKAYKTPFSRKKTQTPMSLIYKEDHYLSTGLSVAQWMTAITPEQY